MPSNIFVLTGAGISAESGLGTFRDKKDGGIWAKFDPMNGKKRRANIAMIALTAISMDEVATMDVDSSC